MNRDLPSFPAVRAFEAAARHLSFKDAAEELHVTQSAVSHQVKSLEDYLGVTLFHRQTRGVTLTVEGKSYLDRVTAVLDQLSAATQSVRGRELEGPLYVRSTPAFAARWLVPRLNDFSRFHPGVEPHISTSLEPAAFTGDGVDVDIRFGHVSDGALHAEAFLESARFPVASPDLLRGRPPVRRPEDLAGYVLLHNEVEDGWAEWFAAAGADNVDSSPGPRFEHCNLTLRAAAEGQGVALAYGALIDNDMSDGRLVRLFDVNLPSTVIYSLVCPRENLDRPRVAAFRDWLLTTASLSNVQAGANETETLFRVAGAGG